MHVDVLLCVLQSQEGREAEPQQQEWQPLAIQDKIQIQITLSKTTVSSAYHMLLTL